MIIEVGKFYRTMNGAKVRVYAVDGGTDALVHGAYLNVFGNWYSATWTRYGVFMADHYDSALNIVSEWTDEPLVETGFCFAWIGRNGAVLFTQNEYDAPSGIGGPSSPFRRAPWLDAPKVVKGAE